MAEHLPVSADELNASQDLLSAFAIARSRRSQPSLVVVLRLLCLLCFGPCLQQGLKTCWPMWQNSADAVTPLEMTGPRRLPTAHDPRHLSLLGRLLLHSATALQVCCPQTVARVSGPTSGHGFASDYDNKAILRLSWRACQARIPQKLP